jgi:hypothetical protein
MSSKPTKSMQESFLSQSGDTTSSHFEESNAGHQHIIGVLENVREILRTCSGSRKHLVQPKAMIRMKMIRWHRLPTFLRCWRLKQIGSTPLTEPTQSPPTSSPKVFCEEEPSVDEMAWLIHCFFEDFNIARDHLKGLWTAYK